MKTRLFLSIFVTAAAAFLTQAVRAADLTVTITDIRAAKGTLMVAVTNSDAAWNNQAKPVEGRKIAVTGKEVVLHFTLPAGSYAVQVIHDENDNGKLDTNFLGIPSEGYGFSNNPTALRRANYDEARFELGEAPMAIVIRLR